MPGPRSPWGAGDGSRHLKRQRGSLPLSSWDGAAGWRGLAEAGGLSDKALQQMAAAAPSFSLEGCRRPRRARAALQPCQEALPGPAAVLVPLSHAQEATSPRSESRAVASEGGTGLSLLFAQMGRLARAQGLPRSPPVHPASAAGARNTSPVSNPLLER